MTVDENDYRCFFARHLVPDEGDANYNPQADTDDDGDVDEDDFVNVVASLGQDSS